MQAALNTPWILDIDTTIKSLYGKQSGAKVSYNPQSVAVAALAALQPRPTLYGYKPGRPSHALHTYWVGNLRLVLDVVVSPGAKGKA